MSAEKAAAESIREMVRFFLSRCTDRSTLHDLDDKAGDDAKWRYANALLSGIRVKTVRAFQSAGHVVQPALGLNSTPRRRMK